MVQEALRTSNRHDQKTFHFCLSAPCQIDRWKETRNKKVTKY